MNIERWTLVDKYIGKMMVQSNAVLDAVMKASVAANLPPISVSPAQGKFLQLLAKINGAKRILEIGTLGGYSTVWLAGALPTGGKIITLEFEPKHAEVAQKNFAKAGLTKKIELRLGAALDTLPALASEKSKPFDFIFIDADKTNNANYFKWALKLSHPGSVIIVDNVVRKGLVVDAKSIDANVLGVRKLNQLIAKEKRVSATTLQTVGSKGYDGFVMALVLS